MASGIYVIVAYKPKAGMEKELLEVVKEHIPVLESQGLVEKQKPLVFSAKDGTLLEVFEWKSQKAIEEAHKNPVVQEMWKRFEKACTYEALANLEECKSIFAHFTPVEF